MRLYEQHVTKRARVDFRVLKLVLKRKQAAGQKLQ